MLATLYRGMKADFSTSAVDFDTTVRNPSRIWRLYGTTNRKGAPTPDRPHRVAHVTIPGRWEAVAPQQVERLASSFAKRPKTHQPRSQRRIDGHGDYRTLDVAGWFSAHNAYLRHLRDDMHAVRCPWEQEHSTDATDLSTATVVWEAQGDMWPNFRCLHAHCEGRGIRDVLAKWADADVYCASAWSAAR